MTTPEGKSPPTVHPCMSGYTNWEKVLELLGTARTEVLNDLIVTTVPYHCNREEKSVWLDRGASIRRQRGVPRLVLHHIPPIAYPGP
jgi:hypothetical protein